MKTNIHPINTSLDSEIQHKIDLKTKPIGALGYLEEIALQLARIQSSLTPSIKRPTIVVFAGDHGIAKTGLVSAFPQEVTHQMVMNFLSGGAAINVFANQHSINLKVVDAGVNFDFSNHPHLIDSKIGYGTLNYLEEAAMSQEQCTTSIKKGASIVQDIYDSGSNIIGFGEMGISNTSSASLLMSVLCDIPIELCIGNGTGLSENQLTKKIQTLHTVRIKHAGINADNPIEVLATYGGFEIAQMCGAILKAAELGMVIMIDGFIATSALLVAHAINKNVLDYCVFTHHSDEHGHAKMLNFLQAKSLLNLGLRLGEGTACALAFPLIQSACAFLNEMASFEEASVSQKK